MQHPAASGMHQLTMASIQQIVHDDPFVASGGIRLSSADNGIH